MERCGPGRVIPGTGFEAAGTRIPLDAAARSFTKDGFKVMGEIGLQYQGISPSDMAWTSTLRSRRNSTSPSPSTWARAAPAEPTSRPTFRGSMGDPLLLEELLARHPKLRVQVMHAGYPMIDNMLTLLQANSHVYVDLAGLIWSYPLKEVNRYIERLVDAGFGDRDHVRHRPAGLAEADGVFHRHRPECRLPDAEQKRDILYNNAARFLRIDTKSPK